MPKFTVTMQDGTTKHIEAASLVGAAQKASRFPKPVKSIGAYEPKMVQRRNLMTGELYWEAEDTPLCCSPASETYWSM
jgi:hypothetical protein